MRFESPGDEVALEVAERVFVRRRLRRLRLLRVFEEMLRFDGTCALAHGRRPPALNRIFELAYVARPFRFRERDFCRAREGHIALVLLSKSPCDGVRNEIDVFAALPQRREANLENVEAIE